MKIQLFFSIGCSSFVLFACQSNLISPNKPAPTSLPLAPTINTIAEQPIREILLAAPLNTTNAEYSGLAWYRDHVVLLPQYPARMGNSIVAIPKQRILDYLDGKDSNPIDLKNAKRITFDDGGLSKLISGFEGFEAITFAGDRIFLAIEARNSFLGGKMVSYIVEGSIAPDLSTIKLNNSPRQMSVEAQAELSNMSDETLVLYENKLISIYEANGKKVNPHPKAHVFSILNGSENGLWLQPELAFPNIEYRITDATPTDAEGKFWAINYMFPGDAIKLLPSDDTIRLTYGTGASHTTSPIVERLVQFQVTKTGIALAPRPPMILQLASDGQARNWEGIAKLDERGFLLITDQHPRTIFAFVNIN
jgi:hypothetical protein